MTAERNAKREGLLSATLEAALKMLRTYEPGEAIPHVLETLGTATGVDRVQLLHFHHDLDGVLRCGQHFGWCAPDVAPSERLKNVVGRNVAADGFTDWAKRHQRGEIIAGSVDEFSPQLRAYFEHDGVKSVVVVPIFVDKEWWGIIGFDSCRNKRHWIAQDVDILKMVAEVIGVAVLRTRALAQLEDARRIIESSSTILFRLTPAADGSYALCYISTNINRYGYDPEALIANPKRWETLLDPEDLPNVRNAIHAITKDGMRDIDAEFRLVLPNGDRIWFYGRATAAIDTWSGLTVVEGIVTDITERKQAALEIERLATTDVVTALGNRAAFLTRLREACKRTDAKGSLLAVHFIDLDGFKKVNDAYGHIAGDELLKAVARRLVNTVRDGDFAARFGGDEFAVLQTDIPSADFAQATAQRICSNLGQPYRMHGRTMRVGASIGVDCAPVGEAVGDAMLARADRALYRAKAEGRNCVRMCDPSSDPPAGSAFASNIRPGSAA